MQGVLERKDADLSVRPIETNSFLANLSKREIPSLNGLRGLAALAIVIWHYLESWNLQYLFPGPYAVTLFFELSGLLITWLLLGEVERTDRIDMRQFYLRRALRLFPAFYVTWTICLLAGPFAGQWFYFFYLGDYYTAVTQSYGPMTHAWSLGVEEKFYLLWPLLLVRVQRSTLIKVLLGVLLVEPIYRLVLVSIGYRRYTWFAFDTHLDAIVLGCLIAVLAKQGLHAPRWLGHPLTPVGAIVWALAFQKISDLVTYLLALLLISVVCRPPALLNNCFIGYFGAISYSLYLSHGLAKTLVWSRFSGSGAGQSIAVDLTAQVAVAIAVASALHFAVERPFLRLKRRMHPVPVRVG